MKFIWIAFSVILATVALALWVNISDPVWAYGFAAAAFAALTPGILKIFKRKSLAEEALDREAFRQNRIRPTKQQPHPDGF